MNAKPKRLLRPRISIGGLLALITFVTVAIVSYQQWVAYRRTENARQWILNVFEMSEFDWWEDLRDGLRTYKISPEEL